jgi:hypothetical protein
MCMIYCAFIRDAYQIRWWQWEQCFKELHKTIPNFQVFTHEREYKAKQPDTSLQIYNFDFSVAFKMFMETVMNT